jgi:hypothetical protein
MEHGSLIVESIYYVLCAEESYYLKSGYINCQPVLDSLINLITA